MAFKYRLKDTVVAFWDTPNRKLVSVKLPAGATLQESPPQSRTLVGMVGLSWQAQYFFVQPKDLLKNAERVEIA